VGTAYVHYKEYELQKALHGTDFGAAALSAEEPSLFWLAVDIIGAGFDVAAAGGGVWKSTNRGKRWTPLTDQLPSLSSGAVAVEAAA